MASYELLAIVVTGLSLAGSIVYYAMQLRNQSLAIKTQAQLEKRKGTLELLNRQITFYAELDGRLNEYDTRKESDPLAFIREKFTQTNVRIKFNDLAIGNSRNHISNFYKAGSFYKDDHDRLIFNLLESVHFDLESLRRKRNELLTE